VTVAVKSAASTARTWSTIAATAAGHSAVGSATPNDMTWTSVTWVTGTVVAPAALSGPTASVHSPSSGWQPSNPLNTPSARRFRVGTPSSNGADVATSPSYSVT